MAKLFGFSIDDSDDKLSPSAVSPVPPNNEDGVDHYMSSGFFGSYVDIEGVYKTENDLLRILIIFIISNALEIILI